MMYTYVVLAMLASGVSCMSVSDVMTNSPTYVPRRCLLDVAKGTCRDETRKYYFNVTAGSCQPFIYNGCGGNWNRFTKLSDCHKACTCALPPETGPCRGYEAKWFYSPADGCCRPFMYGGCGGNSNSYNTWKSCSEACGYPTANSSWWAWGAQWGNATAPRSNTTYSSDKFMRDWMLWQLFANGEGFEMEDIATLIAQAHILGRGKTMGSFAGGVGANKGFGSQLSGQGLSSAFANGFLDAEAMEGQYGTANWGLQTAGLGSFTPLGHVGSANNLVPQSGGHGVMSNDLGFWENMNGVGGQGNGQFWDTQGNAQVGFGQGNVAGMGMFGHGQFDTHGLLNQGSAWGNSNWGTQTMFTGQGQQSPSNFPQFKNVAMEILYYIRKLGRGELAQRDLLNLGKRFGAVSSTGKLNVNLLASEMVKELQGPKMSSNMASIEGIAQYVGALDSNGNIDIPMLVNTLTRSMSDNKFSELLRFGMPSTDEFNWLTKRADVMRTRIGGGSGGGRGNRNRDQGSSVIGRGQTGLIGLSRGSDMLSGNRRTGGATRLGGTHGGRSRTMPGGTRTISDVSGTGLLQGTRGIEGTNIFGVQNSLSRGTDMSSGATGRVLNRASGGGGGRGGTVRFGVGNPLSRGTDISSGATRRGLNRGSGGAGGRGGADGFGFGNPLRRGGDMSSGATRRGLNRGSGGAGGGGGADRFGFGNPLSRGADVSSDATRRGLNRASGGAGGRGGTRGLSGDSGRLAGRGGIGGLGGGLGGMDGISLGGGRGFNTGGLNAGVDGSALGRGRAAVVVNAEKSARMGSYGRK